MKLKKLADLNKRIFVSLIAIFIVGILIIFSSYTLVSLLLVITVAMMSAMGVWEYSKLAQAKDLIPASLLMIVIAVLEVAAFFTSLKFSQGSFLPTAILVGGAVIFFIFHFKDATNALLHVAVEFFGVCYVAVPLSFLLGILYPPTQHFLPQDGRLWLCYLIVVTKITDIAAYFVGRLWGRRKLAPVLSPKKTIEGALAGFGAAILVSYAMHFVGAKYAGVHFNLSAMQSLWMGMLIGIFGQIGDLAESLLKRDAVVKDSNTLPGLGGILDMIDSLLLTAPIVYFFLRAHT